MAIRKRGRPRADEGLDRALQEQNPKELAEDDNRLVNILLDEKKGEGARKSAAGILALRAIQDRGKAHSVVKLLADALLDNKLGFVAEPLGDIAVNLTGKDRDDAIGALLKAASAGEPTVRLPARQTLMRVQDITRERFTFND